MLKREQVSGTRNVAVRNPTQASPVISHILMVNDAARVAVYDSASNYLTQGDTLLWARDNVTT